jgi:hypothetical protein
MTEITKKLFLTIALLSPFLICDPQTGVTTYKLTGPVWMQTSVPAQPDGSIKMDVAKADTGENKLTVAACVIDATWGESCSVPVPFTFVRPAKPLPIGGLRLLPL